jgi:hypothetical protein
VRLRGQWRVQRGDLGELPHGQIQQADHVGGHIEQGEQALRVGAELVVPLKLRELSLDAQVGGHVEDAPSVATEALWHGLAEHDPTMRVEAAVGQAPVRSRSMGAGLGAPPPHAAHTYASARSAMNPVGP